MAEITAALVKELRERTGAGMMDCKKPLPQPKAIWIKQLTFYVKKALLPLLKSRPHCCRRFGRILHSWRRTHRRSG